MSKKTSYLGPLVHIGFLRPFALGILRRWLVHRETMVALVTTLELACIARTLQVTIWHVQGADIVVISFTIIVHSQDRKFPTIGASMYSIDMSAFQIVSIIE